MYGEHARALFASAFRVNQWWATAYCPRGTNYAQFVIVDNGIGIFESLTVRGLQRALMTMVGMSGNIDVLKAWLEGRMNFRPGQASGNGGRAFWGSTTASRSTATVCGISSSYRMTCTRTLATDGSSD